MWLQGELFFPVRLIGSNTVIVKEPIAVVDEANSKKGALLSPHNGQTDTWHGSHEQIGSERDMKPR